MKYLPFFSAILSLMMVAVAHADDDLNRLRLSYQAAVKRVIESPRESYEKELRWLIENRTRRSDLEGAVAARKVLQQFTGEAVEEKTSEPSGSSDKELEELREDYEEEYDRVIKPLRETYLRELEKIMEARTRASDLDAALLVKKEMEKVSEEKELAQMDPIDALFIGRTWVSGAGTAFTFLPDGVCIRESRDRREGSWKRRGSVVISSIEDSPNETRYFRFVSKTEAYYGNSEEEMDLPVMPR